jgi:hypothetical protein
MAIPVLDEPVRRVFCVPLVLIPTLCTSADWVYSTGGVVIPKTVLAQRNDRVLAYFAATIYVIDDGGVGEAKLTFYTQDTRMHIDLDGLTLRSDDKNRQSFIRGPRDVTDSLPGGDLVGVRAAARSVIDGLQVSFFHMTATFLVQ